MSTVQQAIEVGAPLHAVYEQLAHFENYSQFMSGVQEVTQVSSTKTHWIMDLDGERREFDAQITECRPDELVAWRATNGPVLSEVITLKPMTAERTQIIAEMEADVAALMPSDRHAQHSLSRRLKADLTSFKRVMEGAGFTADMNSGLPLSTTMGRAGTDAGMNVGLNQTFGTTEEPGTTAAGSLSPSLTTPGIGPGSATMTGSASMGGKTGEAGGRSAAVRGNNKTVQPSPSMMRNRRTESIVQPAGRVDELDPEQTISSTRKAGDGVGGSGASTADPASADLAAPDMETGRMGRRPKPTV